MRGRPTKYKPEYAEKAEKLALLGMTDVQLAEHFGIAESNFYQWQQRFPEFQEALKKGKIDADAAVVESLFKKAKSGDFLSMAYWINNRCRAYGWSAKQNSEEPTRPTTVNFNFITNNNCAPLQLPNQTIDIVPEE